MRDKIKKNCFFYARYRNFQKCPYMHRKDTKSLHNINNQHLKQRAIGKTYLWLLFFYR